jgi:hypothetical protein
VHNKKAVAPEEGPAPDLGNNWTGSVFPQLPPLSGDNPWWEYPKAIGLGLGQGVLNNLNGVTDLAIEAVDLPATIYNNTAGRLGADPLKPLPKPDWSRNLITTESDDTHNWSKFFGGNGTLLLLSAAASAFFGAAGEAGELGELGEGAAGIKPIDVSGVPPEGLPAELGPKPFDVSGIPPEGLPPQVAPRPPAITPPTNRGGLRAGMGEPPAGLANPNAQHDLPWTFRDWFAGNGRGLNVNDSAYGRWVSGTPPGNHQRWSAAFEAEWGGFIQRNPNASRQEALDFMNQLRADPRFQ